MDSNYESERRKLVIARDACSSTLSAGEQAVGMLVTTQERKNPIKLIVLGDQQDQQVIKALLNKGLGGQSTKRQVGDLGDEVAFAVFIDSLRL